MMDSNPNAGPIKPGEEGVSTWRQALAEDWDARRALTDWMGIAAMHEHVAELHTGKPRATSLTGTS